MTGELADLLDPWQQARLELVRLTAAAGWVHGKPWGSCGEAASDPLLAAVLVGLGVTSLSVAPKAPSAVPEVRATLAGVTLPDCERSRLGCGEHRTRIAPPALPSPVVWWA